MYHGSISRDMDMIHVWFRFQTMFHLPLFLVKEKERTIFLHKITICWCREKNRILVSFLGFMAGQLEGAWLHNFWRAKNVR